MKKLIASLTFFAAAFATCLSQDVEKMMAAASAGEPAAQAKLADYFATGGSGKFAPNYQSAVFWWKKAADQGDVGSITNLGICYYLGNGVPRNMYFSSRYWMKAAKANDASAQYYLGLSYCNGLGVMKDMTLAFYWWDKAAAQGHILAKNNLAFCFSRGEGVNRNVVKAYKLWTEAAEAGNAVAQCKLAQCYYTGEGVRIDRRKAAAIWTAAAEKGDGESQKFLGVCYYRGEGVPQNKKEAYKWFALAAQKGDKEALAAAEQIRLEMPPGTFTAPAKPVNAQTQISADKTGESANAAAPAPEAAKLKGLSAYNALMQGGAITAQSAEPVPQAQSEQGVQEEKKFVPSVPSIPSISEKSE